MSEPPDDDRPLPPGPALDHEGNLTGRPERPEPRPAAPAPPEPEAPLELQERPRAVKELPPDSYREPPPPPSKRPALLGVLLAALSGLAVGAVLVKLNQGGVGADGVRASSPLGDLLGGRRQQLVVESEPEGAVVQIGQDVVGVTPWAGDNRFGEEAEVRVSKRGYQSWKGVVGSDNPARISVTLKKQ